MHLVRGRLAVLCAFVVLLQLSVVGAAALACCQSGCEMDHAVSQVAGCHDEEATSGAHCPMPHAKTPTDAAALADLSLSCGCDKDRAVDLLFSPSGLLATGAAPAADTDVNGAPRPFYASLSSGARSPFVPPPQL